jgi:hypothetical protein
MNIDASYIQTWLDDEPLSKPPYDDIRALLDENERLRKALQEIERFGHNEGHGRGYTCANMAADALEQKP